MADGKKVLISLPINFEQYMGTTKGILESNGFEVDDYWNDTGLPKEELIKLIEDKDGFIVGLDKIDEDVVKAGKKLKVLSKHGIGTDNINIPAATKHGVVVCNTPGSNSNAVADLALGLIICLARNIFEADTSVRKSDLTPYIGIELEGKTLGIIGLGHIGKKVALRARAFGMKVIADDPVLDNEFAVKNGIKYVSKEEIYKQSDFITIHTPLTNETHGLIKEKEITLMKDGCYIVNTARGGIVDEKALADALKSGKIAGAGIDVFSVEPPLADYVLFQAPNIVFSTHMGGSTPDAIKRAGELAAKNIINVINGKKPLNALNPETLEGYLK